jgi:glycosyltransferase involved in cell wall biosynthesis
MDITVVLCTYNRGGSLARTIDSLAGLELPPAVDWDLLVVDNNSTDNTPAVVERARVRHGRRCRYLFEPQQGKSFALNAGIRASDAPILAFVDDDVVVEPSWLWKLTAALQDGRWAGAGGRILPLGTLELPRWLDGRSPYALAPVVVFDPPYGEGPLAEPPWGTNMAFRREMFAKYGGFRTDLGPRPDSAIRSEDTEFGARLLAAGERLRYEPSAVVYHAVSAERLNQAYFLQWWFGKGQADIREHGVERGAKCFIAGAPLYLWRRLAVWGIRWLLTPGAARRFDCKRKAWGIAGAIAECRRREPLERRTRASRVA